MKNIPNPIIHEIDYDKNKLEEFKTIISTEKENKQKLLLNYPTVYIVNDKQKNEKYSVYIGESNDIYQRTIQHLKDDSQKKSEWENLLNSTSSKMFVIGHEHFNKSLTLDIENKLLQYLSSVESVQEVINARTNPQNDYYTVNELDTIFSKIWTSLRRKNKDLFPVESVIKDSAIFKASPFHKLTYEQINAKDTILLKIVEALSKNKVGELILVSGEAGSGKTVLMSSLFYELNQLKGEKLISKDLTSFLLVNHEQQLKVYEQIAQKLGILTNKKRDKVNVSKPTTFINNHSIEEPVDVVIVDEAHLLWTQGKQSYQGKNQLKDLLERARVVVAVFDPNQVLSTEQYWEEEEFLELQHQANLNNNLIQLSNQMRINANEDTVQWIRNLIDYQIVNPIPKDKNYDLRIFDDPDKMYQMIKQRAKNNDCGISRMIATFDWEYVNNKKPEVGDHWLVTIDDWSLPWNLQLTQSKEQKKKNRNLSWAEQEQTINEVGSTFTIQGFDLNYAGVIIGPSVKYRNNQIVFDREGSKNRKATQRRKLKDNTKEYISDTLLKNELNVLLTRGVNGLYIYAVDKELRKALKKASITN
ncbi:DUF2075 domain-containing protein [Enterococcus sp. LJL99]